MVVMQLRMLAMPYLSGRRREMQGQQQQNSVGKHIPAVVLAGSGCRVEVGGWRGAGPRSSRETATRTTATCTSVTVTLQDTKICQTTALTGSSVKQQRQRYEQSLNIPH